VINEINARLAAIPFVPFRLLTSAGKTFDVPSADHLTMTKLRHEIIIEHDDGSGAVINPLHVVALETHVSG
jgi:hypothetical protein